MLAPAGVEGEDAAIEPRGRLSLTVGLDDSSLGADLSQEAA
jgi:hypothetical protein